MFSLKLCRIPCWTLMNEIFAAFYCDMVLSQSAEKFSYPELKTVQMDLKSTSGFSALLGSYSFIPKLTHKVSFQQ